MADAVTSTEMLHPPVVGSVIPLTATEPAPEAADTEPLQGALNWAFAGAATTSPPGSDTEKPDTVIGAGFALLIPTDSVAGLFWTTTPGDTETDTVGPATVPPPIRATLRGLPEALSVMVIDPVRVPVVVGVKVTVIVHEEPAITEVPQLFVCAKSPDAVIEAMARAPLPVLDSVIVCAGDVEPTSRLAKVRDEVDRFTPGLTMVPVPVSATLCGLPEALLATETNPVRAPSAVGLNVTLMVQEPPAATVAPQELVCAKSPDAEMALRASGPVPVFDRVMIFVADDCPTSRLSKATASGASDTPEVSARPVPERATLCEVPGALLATDTDPIRLPTSVGVKVTPKVQVPPAGTEDPQALDTAKSPVAVMPEIDRAALPVFDSVTLCAAEVVPSSRDVKSRRAAESETAGASTTPVPDSETVGLPPDGLDAMAMVPDLAPPEAGANVTESVQLAPAARVPHPATEKPSPGCGALTLVDAFPVFLTVTVSVFVDPTLTDPNDSVDGDTEITGRRATPVPESATVCGLPEALEETDREPVRDPEAVGEKVTVAVQLAPAASDPQPLETAKFPVAVTELMLADALPELVTVTVCALEVLPTFTEPNDSVVGDTEIAGAVATPVPESATVCGLPEALEETDRVPVRAPARVGEKVTVAVQLAPAASDPQPLETAKFPEAVTEPTLAVTLPVLVTVTACNWEVLPTFTDPKVRLEGATEIVGVPEPPNTRPVSPICARVWPLARRM